MPAPSCPSREMLLQYSIGMLSNEQSDDLAGHLESCPDCQATITTLEDAEDTLIGRLRTPPGSESCLAEPQFQSALAEVIAGQEKGPLPSSPAVPFSLGEYQVLEELGRGGMGRVYKALHTKLDRVVAVKVLPRGHLEDRHAITRFEREMKAVGRLAHPNIVQAHDAREIDGTPVLIMEFVDGLDLAEIVHRIGPGDCPDFRGHHAKGMVDENGTVPFGLGVSNACELVRRTALALECAHEHGLVHRDIKPSNIMLTRSGEVKLLDLGLARFYAEATSGEEMTGTGQAMGTADYMAPEQASDSRTVDIRADIYSLGCTLYKLLTGQAPFGGPEYRGTLDKLNAHVHQPPPPISQFIANVPEDLSAILDRLLAKDPANRFPTPAEVAKTLEPFCTGANLIDLITRALSSSPLALRERARVRAEEPAGTVPTETQPAPLPSSSLRRLIPIFIAVAVAFMAAGFALGIIIRITKDGKETAINVPEGSNASIGANGDVNVEMPGQARPTIEAAIPEDQVKDKGKLPLPMPQSYDLVIKDYGMVNVVALESRESGVWQWRVYIPKDYGYSWNVGHGLISPNDFPKEPMQELSQEPYWKTGIETLLTVALKPKDNGDWTITVSSRSLGNKYDLGHASFTIPDKDIRPMLKSSSIEYRIAGRRETEMFKPGEPIKLIWQRDYKGQPKEPTPGFMVWLQPDALHASETPNPVPDEKTIKTPEKIHFSFRYIPWKEVLPQFADQAGLSLMMDAPPPGTFNYSNEKQYTVDEAIDLLNWVLIAKGYKLVRHEQLLMVVDNAKPAQAPNSPSGGTPTIEPSFKVDFKTAKITRGDITAMISANGTIEPAEVVDVSAQVSGRIVSFGDDPRGESDPQFKGKPIDYNSPVEEGTVLARIDDELYKNRVEQEKAGLRRAVAELKLAQTKYEQTFEKAVPKAAVDAAEAALEQSKASLEQAQINLNHTVIKSPVAGVIVARRMNVGQNVGPEPNAPSLFLIAKDLKKMQVWASIDEADIGQIRDGMTASFTVDAFSNEVFKGKVIQIRKDAQRTQNAVAYTVILSFDNSDMKLMPYMTANLKFEIDTRKDVLLVPNSALRWKPSAEIMAKGGPVQIEQLEGLDVTIVRGDKDAVQNTIIALSNLSTALANQKRGIIWVKSQDDKHVRPIEVQTGLSDGTITEISGPDVKEGMEVVVGQTSQPRDAPSPTP